MIDPIKLAVQKVKLEKLTKPFAGELPPVSIESATKVLNNLSIPDKVPTILELPETKQTELPIQSDPELLKKEAMARAQTTRAEAERLLQQRKEEELNKVRSKVELASGLLAKTASLYVKMPITNAKFLAYITYMEAKEKLRELKQKASKENLKKSKDAYTFPMKPPVRIESGESPQVEIPKIPDIRNINLPKIG